MPELPEVETVRRMLERHVRGRTIASVSTSRKRLRFPFTRGLRRRIVGMRIRAVARRGKYLFIHLDGGLTLLSHLGMSGRWLFHEGDGAVRSRQGAAARRAARHVHVRIGFRDGSTLWFQDARRFGLLELHATRSLEEVPLLAGLGPDPYPDPPPAARLMDAAKGRKASIKSFLMDQRRIAGIGNIYASEILFRAGIHPTRPAGRLSVEEWERIRLETAAVLSEAVESFGTTFSLYRTLWNEPGTYGERLFVYDRAGAPCRRCAEPIRRVVLGQRSTFYCPACQPRRSRAGRRRAPRARPTRLATAD